MSGLYLPDVEMPKNCYECLVRNQGFSGDGMKCGKIGSVLSWYDGNRKRMDNCPLIPVPDHGRLIDADALVADLKRQCKEVFKTDAVSPDDFWITRNEAYNERLWTTWCEALFDYLKAAPTIIQADKEGEG